MPQQGRDLEVLGRALEARWHDDIPISAAMGIAVSGYDGARLELRAALAPNVNVHGTAFAGSLFSLASLCGWGLLHLQLEGRGLAGSIVFVEGSIRCLKPVRDDVQANCEWPPAAESALAGLGCGDRARFLLTTRLHCGGALAAEFRGEYALKLVGG